MKNFVQKGDTMEFVAGAAIASGEPVIVGDMVGISMGVYASAEVGVLSIEGVFSLDATNAEGALRGEAMYYDGGSGKVTNVAGSLKKIGHAHSDQDGGTDKIDIKLDR